ANGDRAPPLRPGRTRPPVVREPHPHAITHSPSPTIDPPTCEPMRAGKSAGVKGVADDASASCDRLVRPSDTFSPDSNRSQVIAAPGETARDRGRALSPSLIPLPSPD